MKDRCLARASFKVLTLFLITGVAASAQVANEDFTLFPSDPMAGAKYGLACSISGDHMIVGAPFLDSALVDVGAAYIMERQADGTWLEVAKLTAPVPVALQAFGLSVDIEGDRAIVASRFDGSLSTNPLGNSADVFIYDRRAGGTWTLSATLTVLSSLKSEFVDASVSISGDAALVGIYLTGDNNFAYGEAHRYERQIDGTWTWRQEFGPVPPSLSAWFGADVSLDGSVAVVGAQQDVDGLGTIAGAAYVYEAPLVGSGPWAKAGKLNASDPDVGDAFGSSVSVDGLQLLVGDQSDVPSVGSFHSGAAYVFERQPGGSWVEQVKLTPPSTSSWKQLGSDVSLSGDRALVATGFGTLVAYVFARQLDGSWIGETEMGPVNPTKIFISVSHDGNTALIGTPYDQTFGAYPGGVAVASLGSLYHGVPKLSLATGGTQDLLLRAGKHNASGIFVVLGSVSGTVPGISLGGSPPVHLPLNPDAYLNGLLLTQGLGILTPFMGILDANGSADSAVVVPAGLSPVLAGLTVHHAYVVVSASPPANIVHASNAVSLQLGP